MINYVTAVPPFLSRTDNKYEIDSGQVFRTPIAADNAGVISYRTEISKGVAIDYSRPTKLTLYRGALMPSFKRRPVIYRPAAL